MRTVRLAITAAVVAATAATAASAMGATGVWTFQSAPGLHPAKWQISGTPNYSKLARGYFMTAVFKNGGSTKSFVGQPGPLILDNHLRPVWFNRLSKSLSVTNLMAQSYQGKPVLTWWQGQLTPQGGTVTGQDEVVDQHYHKVTTLTGKNGWVLSPHEFVINGNDAWVTAYQVVGPVDLSPFGGSSSGLLLDSAVQEYDLKTGNLLSTWDVKDHVSLADSFTSPSSNANVPWDAYHINSIQLRPGGLFVVSLRNTWGVYDVDGNTGNIVWTLGGKHSDYPIPSGGHFEWQHMAQLRHDGTLTIFDDHCCGFDSQGHVVPPSGPSRGLILKLDTAHHTATLVHEYRHSSFDVNTVFLGSTQLLGNGNVVVGWGSQPYLSEFASNGTSLLDAMLPGQGADITYRTIVQQWVGLPTTPPSGRAIPNGGGSNVYVSWNGATRVASWRLLAGSNKHHLKTIGMALKRGFETKFSVRKQPKVFEVQALNRRGHVIGTSNTFSLPSLCFYNCPGG